MTFKVINDITGLKKQILILISNHSLILPIPLSFALMEVTSKQMLLLNQQPIQQKER